MSLIALASFVIASCMSLSPEAETIRVTSNANDVRPCQLLGTVHSQPPYIGSNDGVNQLRNNAAALGADTLLLAGRGALRGQTGSAYRCNAEAAENRQR